MSHVQVNYHIYQTYIKYHIISKLSPKVQTSKSFPVLSMKKDTEAVLEMKFQRTGSRDSSQPHFNSQGKVLVRGNRMAGTAFLGEQQ